MGRYEVGGFERIITERYSISSSYDSSFTTVKMNDIDIRNVILLIAIIVQNKNHKIVPTR
jgi:hypothetical protein